VPHPLRLFKREDLSSGTLPDFFQLFDPNGPVGEDGANVEFASHGANDVAPRAEIHVRAALQFGDGGLPDFQLPMPHREILRPDFVGPQNDSPIQLV